LDTWVVDPSHSLVEFSVKHMMIATVKGRFGAIQGVVRGDPSDLTTAEIEMTVDAASIDTREPQRDQHLRSADFFDVERFPQLRFRSKRIQRQGDGAYRLAGDLTIRDVTREVQFDLTFEGRGKDPWGNERAAFAAETRLDRRDFGLTWNTPLETGGILVGNDVRVSVQLETVRQAS
jgi:polyisoprenoid-binding protein YceI